MAAGVTDYLDGWWARTRGPRTRTGEMLDPIADKVFVVTAFVAFAAHDVIPPAALLALLARDIFVTAGVLIVIGLRLPLRLRARFAGKVVTTLQIAAVLVLTIAPRAATAIAAATFIASAWAIIDYTLASVRAVRETRDARTPPGRNRLRPPPHLR